MAKVKRFLWLLIFKKEEGMFLSCFRSKKKGQICNHKNPGLTWKLKIIVEKISAHKNGFTVVILSG